MDESMPDTEFSPAAIHTFPSDDAAFNAHVRELVETNRPATPDELEGLVRQRHPSAVVHEREAIATSIGDTGPLWYVYREPMLSAWD
jgi:hypothetical protein